MFWLDRNPEKAWTVNEIKRLRRQLDDEAFYEVYNQYGECRFSWYLDNNPDLMEALVRLDVMIDRYGDELHPRFQTGLRIVTRTINMPHPTHSEAAGQMGKTVGAIATVTKGAKLTLIGNLAGVELVAKTIKDLNRRFSSMVTFMPENPNETRQEQLDRWASTSTEEAEAMAEHYATAVWGRHIEEERNRGWHTRASKKRVLHKVSELFPQLRVWPEDPDYDHDAKAEVQLRQTGGHRLGGIIL